MNKYENDERVAEMWRRSRYESGKSQDYVAKALGVSKKTIQNWENGVGAPSITTAIQWFACLGVPMYPYIMEIVYPKEFKGISADTNIDNLKQALHTYIDELDELHIRELLFLLYGSHGSSPTGTIDLVTAYLHMPLAMRVSVAENILTNFQIANACGLIQSDDHIMPQEKTLKRCVDVAKEAVMNGKETYTITENGGDA